MKKWCFLLLLWAGVVTLSCAQTDSLEYLNEDWIRVNDKKDATYYKIKHWNDKDGVKGVVTTFYISGEKEGVVPYSTMDSMREGVSINWYKTGQMKEKKYFHQDKMHGICEKWFENGTRKAILGYLQDTLNGGVKTFYPSGELKRNDLYEKGNLKEGHCYEKDGREVIYFPYETPAQYPKGGKDGMSKFLISAIKPPVALLKSGKGGIVVLSFVIDTGGEVKSISVQHSTSKEYEDAVIFALKRMPTWIPATLDGERIEQKFTMPFTIGI